jgi:phage terminase large subunit-like protein
VFEACRRIVEKSPLLRSHAKVTAKQIEFPFCGGSIQAIASDYAGAAGTNPVISVFDELWGYTTERSHRLWDEMTPPPTRKITCRLTVTYAGFEGESVLLENLYKRGLLLPEIGKDLRAGEGLLMFWSHVPIAPWQDQDWLDNSRATMRPNAYARMIENRFSTNLETFIDIDAWDACVDPDLRPEMVHHYLPIWVGIDASVKRDSTAIVATTWDTKKKNVRMICHKIVQPSQANHIDFERDIEDYVLKLCQRFSVKEVLYDPYQMQASAQRLLKARPKVPMTEYPQSVPNITAASQNLYELVKAKGLVAYPDDQIRLAVQRSVAIETPRGWKISKEKASHKIDVVVALGMAAHAAVQSAATSNYNSNYREWV